MQICEYCADRTWLRRCIRALRKMERYPQEAPASDFIVLASRTLDKIYHEKARKKGGER